MKTLHSRCAGLDVHKAEVVACLRLVGKRKVEREVRRFPTTTRGLLELGDWLERGGCTHVAMEATGVYWKPVWHILEDRFALVLANAAHVKNVPGRKSDVNDATWLADLLAHGLIRASFVPPPAIQELRDLTRTRKQLTREIVQHAQRIQAVLEEANVKLASVISNVLGPSGRRILQAMIAGETDAAKLAALGSERLGCPRAALVEALTGRVREHHRFLLAQHLRTIEQLEESIAAFDARIEAALAPFQDAVERLTAVPGIGATAAQVIIAEIGDRHEPVSHRGASSLLGGARPAPRRKRRQTPFDTDQEGRSLAQAHAGTVRLGRSAQEKQLFPSPIPAPESASRGEKGGRRGRRLDPHNRLSHAGRWDLLPRSRSPPLRASRSEQNRSQTCEPYPKPRLSRRNQTGRMTPVSRKKVEP